MKSGIMKVMKLSLKMKSYIYYLKVGDFNTCFSTFDANIKYAPILTNCLNIDGIDIFN